MKFDQDYDHRSVCKPDTKEDQRYYVLRDWLQKRLEENKLCE